MPLVTGTKSRFAHLRAAKRAQLRAPEVIRLGRDALSASGLALLLISMVFSAAAQTAVPTTVGDAPENPGPRAVLQGSLRTPDVRRALKLVADRELSRTADTPSRDWTFVPLYLGLLETSRALDDPRYHDGVLAAANSFGWKLGPRELHADDQAIGQVYLELYIENPDPSRISPMRAQFDQVITLPDPVDVHRPVWWWCDALFMAPPVWTGLSQATGDRRYRDYSHHQWMVTDHLLWSADDSLFYRDASFLKRREKNGRGLFWSRGNGWVLAGIARSLNALPGNDPGRKLLTQRFISISQEAASLQGDDGLWRSGLLDEADYTMPETSGSSFFVYAMAWGVDHGILPRNKYLPIIRRGWAGLVSQVYADGRLGSVQPIAAAPGVYSASSSYVYGSGAFLLAGSEIIEMQAHKEKR